MSSLHKITDIDRAETLWRACVPPRKIFDLWEVRLAFHQQYQRPFQFLADEGNGRNSAFLPLSWVEEKNAWCCFPGETWENRTWLEQNPIRCAGLDAKKLMEELGGHFHLRYLDVRPDLPNAVVDEIGYIFRPPAFDYNLENWWTLFHRKKEKLLRRTIQSLLMTGAEVRTHDEDCFDLMVEMSRRRFGALSYFADPRFREGFRGMLSTLFRMGLLRTTTVHVDGKPAAIDFGSVYHGCYTLLAGATDPQICHAAKLINLHHMEWACRNRLDEVDFLCGGFSWKPLFKLEPRPLYLFTSQAG